MLREPWKTWFRQTKIVDSNTNICLVSIPESSISVSVSLEGAVNLLTAIRRCIPSIITVIPIEESFANSITNTKTSLHTVNPKH